MRNPTFKGFLSGHFNKQQVYDFVKERLLEQKCASNLPAYNGCAYRGENGTKCAVGWLIPDKSYDPSMEGDIDALYDFYDINTHESDSSVEKYEFLSALQEAHDALLNRKGKEFVKSITPRLNLVAIKYGLNP